jgi:hypothetical protein
MNSDQPRQVKESVIRHVSSPRAISSSQVTQLALELSRKADQTVDLDAFKSNCRLALQILAEIQAKLDQ